MVLTVESHKEQGADKVKFKESKEYRGDELINLLGYNSHGLL